MIPTHSRSLPRITTSGLILISALVMPVAAAFVPTSGAGVANDKDRAQLVQDKLALEPIALMLLVHRPDVAPTAPRSVLVTP